MAKKYSAKVEVTGDSTSAERAAKKTQSAFGKLGNFIKDRFVVTLGDVTNAVRGVVSVMGDAVAAADRQEEAVNNLNSAMKASGDFSEAASKDMQDFASQLQKTTTIGDETTLEMLALAKSFGRTNEEAKRMVRTAADFSVAAKINLEEALRRIGRAAQGSVDDISKFAPEIRELTKEQLAAGEATRVLEERFGGLAQAQAQTSAGIRKQLLNALVNLQETLGQSLTKNKDFNEAMKSLRDTLSDPALAQGIANIVAATVQLVKFQAQVSRYTPIVLWGKAVKSAWDTVAGWAGSIGTATAALVGMASGTDKATTAVDALTRAEERAKRINDALSGVVASLGEELNAFGVTLLPEVNKQIEKNNETLAKARDAYSRMARTVDGELIVSYEKLVEIEAKISVENQRLRDELNGVTEASTAAAAANVSHSRSLDGVAVSSASASAAMSAARGTMVATGQQAVFTASQFDQLAASQGRVAATAAAVAGGGQVILGGTRVNLPGGGSRLTHDPQPFGTSNLGGAPTGTSSRSSLGRPRL